MGQGGQLVIVNATPYNWRKTDESSYQMKSWKLPDNIPPGTVGQVYVEFDGNIFITQSDTGGHTNYAVEGTPGTVRFEVSDKPSRISARLSGISISYVPENVPIPMGWNHNGETYFILSGKQGSFSTINPPIDWMQRNLSTLGNRPLHKIAMVGSHDAGMSTITWADHIPDEVIGPFTLTQARDIGGQLNLGSRYFDIRPEISNGQYYTGHYGGGGSKLGARGQKISDIIDDLNAFTTHNAELIIINLSHAMQTDDNFRDFNLDEWHALLKELLRINHRFIVTGPEADDVSLLPLSRFIGNGQAAVVIVVEANIDLGDYRNQGFYLMGQLNIVNDYANKDDLDAMVADQLQKMTNHAKSGDKRMFLISWTLTQQPPSDVASLKNLRPIHVMADKANKAVVTRLFPVVGPDAFPNVVYLDFIESNIYAAFAMALNDKVFNN
ncbi:hypothetical protein AA313_de0207645 [Arthrobotrys entomopaga]|nr:hypothetical protein AA313_de0207645 [Arthrobotrys entomopaga]